MFCSDAVQWTADTLMHEHTNVSHAVQWTADTLMHEHTNVSHAVRWTADTLMHEHTNVSHGFGGAFIAQFPRHIYSQSHSQDTICIMHMLTDVLGCTLS